VENDAFWQIRSANYDKLFWAHDRDYLSAIVQVAGLEKHHLVLDVGTGTGAVANEIKGLVDHVVAIDLSASMLEKGNWTGVSALRWDIGELLFADAIFHRVFARMVFHHILDNLDRAVLRCYDLLKDGGKIIVAEGVPPVDKPGVVQWYTEMFRFKEERRTFTPASLGHYLTKNGFKNVLAHIHYTDSFSIANWLTNSGLDDVVQRKIMDLHRHAPAEVKDAYEMRISDDDCLVRTKNVILVGEK